MDITDIIDYEFPYSQLVQTYLINLTVVDSVTEYNRAFFKEISLALIIGVSAAS